MNKTATYLPLTVLILFLLMYCTKQKKTVESKAETIASTQKDSVITTEERDIPLKSSPIPVPSQLNYQGFSNAEFCKSLICKKEKFYPIGWTSTGYFVYFKEMPPDFAETILTLIIQDLANDEKIVEKSWEGVSIDNFQNFINKTKDEVTAIFNQYKIEKAVEALSLMTFPFEIEDVSYDTQIEETTLTNGLIEKQVIIVEATHKGQKTVHSMKQEGYFGITISKILGCYQNPAKDRIAILKLNGIKGMEDSRTSSIEIIGCALDKGFQ